MVISTQGSLPMEETAAALGDSPRWYQLYWSKDDDVVDSFVARAEAIGSEAIVVTLDTHVLGLAHPRPRRRLPAVRPRRGDRAVHQ